VTRLYHSALLACHQTIILDEGQTHYLRNVLRVTAGQKISIFNEREGEWSAHITSLAKKGLVVEIGSKLRPPDPVPKIALFFAPLKQEALSFLMEKATELGVQSFHPVLTERCTVSKINHDRLLHTITNAAQQCERFDIPHIHALVPLREALATWSPTVPVYVCRERGKASSAKQIFQNMSMPEKPAFFIGPEGGFSPGEINRLKTLPFVHFISLGSRILRAETAALAILASYQAIAGDWEDDNRLYIQSAKPDQE
jgi:16S rRNA (uracil1498-N3)-methyltransferase